MENIKRRISMMVLMLFILSFFSGITGNANIGDKITVVQNFQTNPGEYYGGYVDEYGFMYKNASVNSHINFELYKALDQWSVRTYSANSTLVIKRPDGEKFDLVSFDLGVHQNAAKGPVIVYELRKMELW